MAYLLGVDTGGTYTDAVIVDDARDRVLASAKSLTTRPDLALGISGAIDAALAQAGVQADDIAMVSLSTTLATNALVEGQGGKVAFVAIGFDDKELQRAGLSNALGGDPIITLQGGHDHAGQEQEALQIDQLNAALDDLSDDISGFAIAARFATRNAQHETTVRDAIRAKMDRPVTCSHELSSALGGPKRALTAVLNARLIGLIDGLITACSAHLAAIGVSARLMVVRGDGALVSSDMAREKPIETILSGPAASVAGARWLTQESDALVSDIGGTTTDVCLLRDGKPQIDPEGARVGPYRTMVEAVAMRTTGLGGDSQVHVNAGLVAGLTLGPKRLLPISLAAQHHPEVILSALESYLGSGIPPMDDGQFVIPLWSGQPPQSADKREQAIMTRLESGAKRLGEVVVSRIERPALGRLVSRGSVVVSGVTPSDAAHVLGLTDAWHAGAAETALTLFARQRSGAGEPVAQNAQDMAQMIIDQLSAQTVDCILESAFAEDSRDFSMTPGDLSAHPLAQAGLDRHSNVVQTQLSLAVPVIGLGASAPFYYGAVGQRLGTKMVLPDHAHVANAIGAVVGQMTVQATGSVSANGPGIYVAYLSAGPQSFNAPEDAMQAMEQELRQSMAKQSEDAGILDPDIQVERTEERIDVEGTPMFISAELRASARGRPRIAVQS